jgi:hypothetical protein
MMLADMTPETWGLVGLSITTVFGFGYAFLAAKKGTRNAKILEAFGVGLKKAAQDKALHTPTIDAIVDGIYAAAADLNVSEAHVDDHVPGGNTSTSLTK